MWAAAFESKGSDDIDFGVYISFEFAVPALVYPIASHVYLVSRKRRLRHCEVVLV